MRRGFYIRCPNECPFRVGFVPCSPVFVCMCVTLELVRCSSFLVCVCVWCRRMEEEEGPFNQEIRRGFVASHLLSSWGTNY